MKKLKLFIAAILILVLFIPLQSNAATESSSVPVATNRTTESETANVLLKRLFEINEMDKANLNLAEKRELRKEVRSIRDDLKKLDGGIYLSVGAIIIILLILILIL